MPVSLESHPRPRRRPTTRRDTFEGSSQLSWRTQPFRTQSVLRRRLGALERLSTFNPPPPPHGHGFFMLRSSKRFLGLRRPDQSTRFFVAEVLRWHFVHLLALSLMEDPAVPRRACAMLSSGLLFLAEERRQVLKRPSCSCPCRLLTVQPGPLLRGPRQVSLPAAGTV